MHEILSELSIDDYPRVELWRHREPNVLEPGYRYSGWLSDDARDPLADIRALCAEPPPFEVMPPRPRFAPRIYSALPMLWTMEKPRRTFYLHERELGLPPLLRRRWGIDGVGVHERP